MLHNYDQLYVLSLAILAVGSHTHTRGASGAEAPHPGITDTQ